jgi:opacity protein-like surface antigen
MIARFLWGLAVLALCAAPAMAADLDTGEVEAIAAETPTSRIYIRADMSYAFQRAMDTQHFGVYSDYGRYTDPTDVRELDDTVGAGVGAGMRFGHNLRGDITLDVRQKAKFSSESWQPYASALLYGEADVRSTVALANIYYDFARGGQFTPYIGAGIGFSYNETSSAQGINANNLQAYDFQGQSKTDFAWALMAGVSKNMGALEIDLGYRYLNMGDASYDLDVNCHGSCLIQAGADIIDLNAHEIRLGLRYNVH